MHNRDKTNFDIESVPEDITRRTLLKAGLGLAGVLGSQVLMPGRALAALREEYQLASVVVSNTNPYMLDLARGASIFAQSVGIPFKSIVANGDSQQQLSQIQATIASGKKLIMTICAVNSADIPAIVRAVSQSGGFITTQWNKPKGFEPWNVSPNYVAHLAYDGYSGGYWTATQLFKAMGGKGGVVAFQGRLDAIPTQQRYIGMQKALKDFPGIKLLDTQVANWERQQAYDKTKTLMTKYGSQLQGIWSASDSMASGAYAAFEQSGRISQCHFTGNDGSEECLKLIQSGPSFVASYTSDGVYNGALGLAMAFAAATGKLDVRAMSHQQRDGNYLQYGIDKSNVGKFLKPATSEETMVEVNKGLFARLNGPALD